MKKTYFLFTILIFVIGNYLIASQVSKNDRYDGNKPNKSIDRNHAKIQDMEDLNQSETIVGFQIRSNDTYFPVQDFRSMVADFSADLTLIPVTNSVNFTDLSTGTITVWMWSFPGGTPATYTGHIPPPVYYSTAGSYDVTLATTDGVDTVTTTKTAYINVVDYPTGWEFTKTATSHLISIATTTTFSTPLQPGDFIGAFYLDENGVEKCGGTNVWDGVHNKVVVAFGDDATTSPLKEGFASGENFIWKVYFNTTSNVKNASVTYNAALPNSDGKFYDNGLSAIITVNTNPLEIDATADPMSICAGTSVQLDVTVIGGTGSYTYAWTSNPAGFTSTLKNPVHSPAQTTIYTVTVYDGLTSVSDNVTVTVAGQPTANAGADATICQTANKTLPGTASNYSSTLWSTSGDGTFNNAGILYATYTPGASDITVGSATLTLTASPINPCTVNASDVMILTIRNAPVCDAGTDATICQTGTHTLSGSAQNNTGVAWSTSGNGTFSSTTILNPVYTPGTTDITNGTVTLTLTASAVSPCTVAATDTKILTIQKSPTANAGSDATICTGSTHQLAGAAQYNVDVAWTTSGNGTFSNSTILNPIYTPGTTDITNGTVTLTLTSTAISPCTIATADAKILTIRKLPTANAGNDATVCETSTHQLSGSAQNYASVLWTTSGDGTFSSSSILSPVYTPGSTDISNGTVTLTLTAAALNPCTGSATDDKILVFQKTPVADAGSDATICTGSNYQLSGTSQYNGSIGWTTTGDGTFSSTSSLTPVYTPGSNDLIAGTVSLTITASAISPCTISSSGEMILTLQNSPTADAGSDVTICQTSFLQLSGISQNYFLVAWTTSGDGTFNDTSILDPIYFPGTTDIADGTVMLTLTASAISPCVVSASDSRNLVIQKSPEANAGPDAIICEGDGYQLSGTTQYSGSIEWSTSGKGSFNDSGIPDPVYTPDTDDILTGTVTLTLTATPVSPCTMPSWDDMILTIQNSPVAYAGNDATICENSSYILIEATEANNSSVSWTTTGDGAFDDAGTLNPTYTPGSIDVAAGYAELCLTVEPVNPCTLPDTDCMTVIIQQLPGANAGTDATICETGTYLLSAASATNFSSVMWTGNVDNATALNPVYTPTEDDITAGFAELCLTAEPINPCAISASDCLIITIETSPVVDAGGDQTICEDQTAQLAGSADNYSSLLWTGNVDNPAVLNPVYTPTAEDIAAGFAELCFTAEPIDPCSIAVNDCMSITVVSLPEVNAGDDAIICKTQTFTTNPTVTYSTQVFWTTIGDGYFDDATSENTVYNPGAGDLLNGSVELCLLAVANVPCQSQVEDCLTLTFQPLPAVDAGVDATICENETFLLNAAASNYSSLSWTGNVDDPTSLNPVYTPTEADILAGFAELCLTAQPTDPCTLASSDCVIISIQSLPVANAGIDATIGEGLSYTVDSATAANYSSLLWTTTGDGVFNEATILYPTYTPGIEDNNTGSATLCLKAEPISPCILFAEDCMTITIELLPVANAGSDKTVCEGENYTLTEATAVNYSALLWTTGGDGSFDDATMLNPTYSPGINDIALGTVELCLSAQPIPPSAFVAEDCMTLDIVLNPTAFAGPDISVCEGETASLLLASASNYSAILWVTTNGAGFFDNENIVNPVYYPSILDFQLGCVDLMIMAAPVDPCTSSEQDDMQLCFQALPLADAGNDASICENEDFIPIEASVFNYSAINWATTGDGVYNDPSILNPTYVPGSGDILTGTAELTLTADPLNPCVISATSSMVLTIIKNVTVDAGADLTLNYSEINTDIQLNGTVANSSYFVWSTDGDGTFDNTAIENPVYTPGNMDIMNGGATLNFYAESFAPCQLSIADQLILTIITEATAFAGNDTSICEGDSQYLSDASASFYSSLNWTTSGDGFFDDPSALNPVYTPGAGDISNGLAQLCLVAQPIAPSVFVAEACLTLSIQNQTTANAGTDMTVCELESVSLSEATANNYAAVIWFTTNGAGYFSDEHAINPVYYPSILDFESGCIDLNLTASPINPCVAFAEDMIQVCFQKLPEAFAGNDGSVCGSDSFKLAEATAANYASVTWSSSGDGIFDDPYVLYPIYTPGTGDMAGGTAELTLTVQPVNPCTFVASSSLLFTMVQNVTADAGTDQTLCLTQANAEIQLDATVTNSASILWTTNGDGTFDNAATEDPVYITGANDFQSGSVILTLDAEPLQPCTLAASDQVSISILLKQEIVIPSGWSGISSFVQPADPDILNLMSDMLTQLIIMYNYDNEIYYPQYNIQTLQNWDYQKGYFIKVNGGTTLNICGSRGGNLTLNLTAGWNIIPVLSNQNVPVSDVFAPLGNILTIIKEIAGNNIYYPEYGIYTLNSLICGKAYLVRVTEDCTITFPENVIKSHLINAPENHNGPDVWGEIIPTPISHQVIFPSAITGLFNPDNVIGAFSPDGVCTGTFTIDENYDANALTVFGDDIYTLPEDGMLEGQAMHFKLFRPGTSEEINIEVEFEEGMNNDHFATNGISLIRAINLVSVSEINAGPAPKIYPNPAKDRVSIEFGELQDGSFTVEMMNTFGEVVIRTKSATSFTSLDMNGVSRGVYYLRLSNGNKTFIEKLILR